MWVNYPFICITHVQLDQYEKQQISESIASDSKDRRDKQADGKSFCAVSNTVSYNEMCQTFLSGLEDGKHKPSDIGVSLTTIHYLPEPEPFMTEQTNTDETSQCKLNLRGKGQTLMSYNTVAASSFGSLHWPLCVANSTVIGDQEKYAGKENRHSQDTHHEYPQTRTSKHCQKCICYTYKHKEWRIYTHTTQSVPPLESRCEARETERASGGSSLLVLTSLTDCRIVG